MLLEVVIAEFVPDFDTVMGVVGGTIAGPLIFIIPPLLYRRIRQMEKCHRRVMAEARYGSMPLDLNFVADTDLEMEQLIPQPNAASNNISNLKKCWHKTKLMFKYLQCQLSFSLIALIFGISATFFSTYLNIFKISDLFRNGSPCFGNLTKGI